MTCREILTLQFGHYANFVGAHWWNAQELSFEYNSTSGEPSEINHDVLFREGQTPRGDVTYTPRVLISDLQGSLKSLPIHGSLYNPAESVDEVDSVWFQPPVVEAEPLFDKNVYQKSLEAASEATEDDNTVSITLEDNVNVWSDFLYTRYHPRTVNIIKQFEHNSKDKEFDSFPLGYNTWKGHDYEDEFVDKIRMYIEECDSLQGFQVLTDATNAFAGLSSACIQYLHDEYATKSIFAIPLLPPVYDEPDGQEEKSNLRSATRILNLAYSFTSFAQEANIFTPLCLAQYGFRQPHTPISFNHLEYKIDLMYHTTAILAAAIDTFTLPYRKRGSIRTLGDIAASLTTYGRKAVAGSLCLPFSLNQDADLIDCLDKWDGPLSHSLTPECKIGDSNMVQIFTLRGVPQNRLKRPAAQAVHQRDMPAYKSESVAEMLNMYCAYAWNASATTVFAAEKGLCVKIPFPQIFKPEIGVRGDVLAEARPANLCVESVPVLAGLHTGAEMGAALETLHSDARRVRIARFHHFADNGYGKDELEECLDQLFTLRENYEDNYVI